MSSEKDQEQEDWRNTPEECEHERFSAKVDCQRLMGPLGNIAGFGADVRIQCLDCGQSMVFVGLDVGCLPDRPTCSADGTEARLPMRLKHD